VMDEPSLYGRASSWLKKKDEKIKIERESF
jgi:hypothetical protein